MASFRQMFKEACTVVYESFVSKERQKLRNAMKYWCCDEGCIHGGRVKLRTPPVQDFKTPTFENWAKHPFDQQMASRQLMVIDNTVRVPRA